MSSHPLACIYDVRDRINQLRSIPTIHHNLLEHRLVIACNEFKRRSRGEKLRSRKEIKARTNEKRAHTVYLRILDEDPQIFLPFLLVINTNTACVKYNLELFRKHHDQRACLCLCDADRLFLEDIATRRGIKDNPAFQKLIQAIFPSSPGTTANSPAASPATSADGSERHCYISSPLEVVRCQFGVAVYEAICKAPPTRYTTATMTGSVRMDFPSIALEDCILWLDVGNIDLFQSVLFPTSLRGQACTAAAALIFGSQVYEAIDTSQLRVWERNAGLTNATNCITIKVHATSEPGHGTLRLRLEFIHGLEMAKRFFAE